MKGLKAENLAENGSVTFFYFLSGLLRATYHEYLDQRNTGPGIKERA